MKYSLLKRILLLGVVSSAIVATTSRADFPSAVSGLGPVGYWRFSATNPVPAGDYYATNLGSLGAAQDGPYVSYPTRGVSGALAGDPDTAMSLDGSGQAVIVPYSSAANPSGPFSVEFWAYPTGPAAQQAPAAALLFPGSARLGWTFYRKADDTWTFWLGNDPAGYVAQPTGGTVVTQAWQQVVGVYDGESAFLYVNGDLVSGPITLTAPFTPNNSGALGIGKRGSDGAWAFAGKMDEFAIYPSALSAAQVLAHYQNATNASRTTAYSDLVKTSNPLLYYRLDEPALELPVATNLGSWGPGANGVYQIGSTAGVPGPQNPNFAGFEARNPAVYFNGVSGIVRVPPQNLTTDTATFLCWLKRNGDQPTRAGIMHNRGNTSTATGLGFQDSGNALSYNWNDHGENYNFNPAFVPPDQEWTLAAVTVAPDQSVMYMGTSAGLVAATNTYANTAHDFSQAPIDFGWDNYQSTRVMKGTLDEFAIFDKALTYAQISSIYNAALPAITRLTRAPADPVYEGMTVTFTAAVAGTSPTYQWRKGGTPITGKTAATLVLNNVTTGDSGTYDVVVTASGNTLTSSPLPLTVLASAPIITQQPQGGTRYAGGSVTLSVQALGTVPMTYQWSHNGTAIPGATTSTLTLSDLISTDAGTYKVHLANPVGALDSADAALTVVAPAKFAANVMAAGPVAYWPFNETSGQTASDFAGGFDGTYGGFPTNGAVGPRPPTYVGFDSANTAYTFNGANAYIQAPDALDVNHNAFTISVWILVNTWNKDWQAIVTKGDNSWRLHRNSNTDFIGFGTTGLGNQDLAGTRSVNDGQWHHVVAVYDGAKKSIYIDGTLDASVATTGTVSANNYPVRIGENAQATGRYFDGRIDEVALFNRALSEAEITGLYTQATVGPSAPQIVTQPMSQAVSVGQPVSLYAAVSGGAPYTFQWKLNGTDVAGAVRPTLSIASSYYTDAGSYTVAVTNSMGGVVSQPAVLTVAPPPLFANLTNSLVVHLKFDGNYSDSSGRTNDATVNGAPTLIAGKIGTGALHYFTDTATYSWNYLSLGTPADLQFGAGQDFSVAFWTRFTGLPGDLPFLANDLNSYGDPGVTIAPSWQEGGWSWYISDASSAAWQGIGLYDPVKATLNDGQWHSLVYTFERSGFATVYLDGVVANQTSIAAGENWNLDTGNPWTIGQAGGSYQVDGQFDMDDLGIWRKALTQPEAESIYTVGQNYGRSFDTYGPVKITPNLTSSGLELIWQAGTLLSADDPAGQWTPVAGATAPYFKVPVTAAKKFYRVQL